MSNTILDRAVNWKYLPFSYEKGDERVVAYGDRSGKCPTYVRRVPPCTGACPSGEDIRGINNILRGVENKKASDKYREAFMKIVDKNPFPFVMGQVCPAPCQDKCNRSEKDETVAINAVEHFLGDYAIKNNIPLHPAGESTGKRVAIVGSGPAGLSCAYQLRRKGHAVTIYEANDMLGGMLRYGTLGYRVSRTGLDAEISRIIDTGCEVKLSVKVGKDLSIDELISKYDAVFVAVGAQKGISLPIPGAQGSYVYDTISFLKQYESTKKVEIGKELCVIGDGDVAMDAARLALRLGSSATILSGVSREDMNCSEFEYNEALHEGTKFEFQVSVKEVLRNNGHVVGLKVVNTVKKNKGEEGWNHPVPFFRYKEDPSSMREIKTGSLVFAIGQGTDMSGLEKLCKDNKWLNVDEDLMIKGSEKVFGGGDAIKIELITTAIGHGSKAADSIDRYLKGEQQPKKERLDIIRYPKLKSDHFLNSKPAERVHLPVEVVTGNFDPFLQAISEDAVKKEAERCMSCGLCFECDQCLRFCPQDAIIKWRNNPIGEVMFTKYEQCVGCHICAEVCPTGYIDMGMGE